MRVPVKTTLVAIFLLLALLPGKGNTENAQNALPIIDLHMHARVADHYGSPPLLMCASGGFEVLAESSAVEASAVADWVALADRIITRHIDVREGERVWIKVDGDADLDFVDALAVATGRVGAHPVVTRFSNEMLRGWYLTVPDEVDARPDPWLWGLYKTADVLIEFDAFDYGIFSLSSEARYLAWEKANSGVIDLARQRDMRVLRIGNGLYPGQGRAATFGVTEAELAAAFWLALGADPDELAGIGERLRAALAEAEAIRITSANDTELDLRVATRSIVVADGSLAEQSSPEELNITWLPSGEVTLGIDPASVQGRLVVERVHFDGEELRNLVFEFEAGRLTALHSASDISRLQNMLATAPAGLDSITGLKIGLNSAIDDWRLLPWMSSGVVSLSLGANRLLGGEIDLPFLLFLSLEEASLQADGRMLVKDGVILP